MTRDPKRTVALVAIALLVVSTAAVWEIGTRRDRMAADARASALSKQVAARVAPSDYDGDGIADSNDACPTRPERYNGFQDGDGCPDVATSTGAS